MGPPTDGSFGERQGGYTERLVIFLSGLGLNNFYFPVGPNQYGGMCSGNRN